MGDRDHSLTDNELMFLFVVKRLEAKHRNPTRKDIGRFTSTTVPICLGSTARETARNYTAAELGLQRRGLIRLVDRDRLRLTPKGKRTAAKRALVARAEVLWGTAWDLRNPGQARVLDAVSTALDEATS